MAQHNKSETQTENGFASFEALLNFEWVPTALSRAPHTAGRREFPTPNPAPGQGSPLRRTGSGSGATRLACPKPLSVQVAGGASRVRFAGLRPPLTRHRPLTLGA